VQILNLRTGALRAIPDEAFGGQPQSVTWTPDGRRLAYFLYEPVVEDGIERVGAVMLYTTDPGRPDATRLATLPAYVMAWDGLTWAP
jgi:hypothetical protein